MNREDENIFENEEIKDLENININYDLTESEEQGINMEIHENINLEDKEILNTVEISEIPEKKKSKLGKSIGKFMTMAACFTFLGAGIGIGYIVSKNLISEYQKNNFQFKLESSDKATESVVLTSNSISSVFEEVGNSVVNISTTVPSFFGRSLQEIGSGSGIIYKIDGDTVYIITNNHVIENANTISISITGKEQVLAKLIGADASSDIAVLSVSEAEMEKAGISDITVARFADSDKIKVGEFVFPIGNALGRGKTITQGIISAQNKQINVDGKSLTVLQTDAAINPGNSGGALINSEGKVVGINTAKLSSSAIEGIGYAIPTNIALQVAEDIIQNGSVQRPYLGIVGETITEDIQSIYNLKTGGVFITSVEEGSSAANAGLIPTDIIIKFKDSNIKSLEELSKAIKLCKANEVVPVKVIRNGYQEISLNVTLSSVRSSS